MSASKLKTSTKENPLETTPYTTRCPEGMLRWFREASECANVDSLQNLHAGSRWGYMTAAEWTAMCDAILVKHVFRDGEDVLDVGCGVGAFLLHVRNQNASLNLFGIELEPQSAAKAASLFETSEDASSIKHIVCGDARALPWKSISFDHVVSNCVLPYLPTLPDVLKAMSEMHRVCKVGGRITVSLLADREEDQRSFSTLIPRPDILGWAIALGQKDFEFVAKDLPHQGQRYSVTFLKV